MYSPISIPRKGEHQRGGATLYLPEVVADIGTNCCSQLLKSIVTRQLNSYWGGVLVYLKAGHNMKEGPFPPLKLLLHHLLLILQFLCLSFSFLYS